MFLTETSGFLDEDHFHVYVAPAGVAGVEHSQAWHHGRLFCRF